jgi:hypothetical protein
MQNVSAVPSFFFAPQAPLTRPRTHGQSRSRITPATCTHFLPPAVWKKSPASVRLKKKQNKSMLGERMDAVHLHLNGDFVYRSVFYCFLFQTVCSNFCVLRARDSG